ncbi:GGDEF domain-containing response regulator [Poseidonibacter antarcticus]|uniref:GGDEF domain-containing response regulator n=1 Tax=Poseidonibacter antarcticus TaxID=2478538 RepID=UPI000EF450E3|nr:diguanylate cyclase [Poseidonibacter antarcticus]
MNQKIVLIVDDEPTNINIVAENLHNLYQIRIATDGITALEMLDKVKPDLILLDINMPKMNGYEVADRIKSSKETENIPFIFLTAKNDSKSVVKGFNKGAIDYISKPFSKEELQARVSTHLKLYELKNSLEHTVNELEHKIQELDESRKEFETIFDKSLNGIALTDLNTNFLMTNDSFSRIIGYNKEELKNQSFFSLSLEDESLKVKEIINDVLTNGYVENINKVYKVKDKIITANISISLMPDKKTLLYNIADITQLKKAEFEIKQYIKLMDQNIISSNINLKGVVTNISKAFLKISGFKKEELIGNECRIIHHSNLSKETYSKLWSTLDKNLIWEGELENKRKDVSTYWLKLAIHPDFDIANGQKIGYTFIMQDITDKKRIEEISLHDELTKLYNRRHFNQVLHNELNRAKRDKKTLSFMMLDVDYFKFYNDTYGHQEGDKVLCKISKVLNSFCKRAGDFAFRLGGEEFGILFSELSQKEAEIFANVIRKAIENLKIPHEKNVISNVVTISIGLLTILYNEEITEIEIYKKADDLLYKAKETGRNKVCAQ